MGTAAEAKARGISPSDFRSGTLDKRAQWSGHAFTRCPAAGCAACKGAKRGAWGETVCRRCGRPFQVKSSAAGEAGAANGGAGGTHDERGWCDEAVGDLALWVHRTLRGTEAAPI